MNNSESSSSDGHVNKASKKRSVTEKRAEQNRRAQRTFRDRKKEHLRILEYKASQYEILNAKISALADENARLKALLTPLDTAQNYSSNSSAAVPIFGFNLPPLTEPPFNINETMATNAVDGTPCTMSVSPEPSVDELFPVDEVDSLLFMDQSRSPSASMPNFELFQSQTDNLGLFLQDSDSLYPHSPSSYLYYRHSLTLKSLNTHNLSTAPTSQQPASVPIYDCTEVKTPATSTVSSDTCPTLVTFHTDLSATEVKGGISFHEGESEECDKLSKERCNVFKEEVVETLCHLMKNTSCKDGFEDPQKRSRFWSRLLSQASKEINVFKHLKLKK